MPPIPSATRPYVARHLGDHYTRDHARLENRARFYAGTGVLLSSEGRHSTGTPWRPTDPESRLPLEAL